MDFVYKKPNTQTVSTSHPSRRRLWTVLAQGILHICTGAGPPALAICRVGENRTRPDIQTLHRSD